jgi:hypothetical protein
MTRWAALLVGIVSIGLIGPPSVAGQARASTTTGHHGVTLTGSPGTTRTTAQLLASAARHPGQPHPPLPVGRGPAKQPNPEALPSGPEALTTRRPSAALTTAQSFDGPALDSTTPVFPPDTQGDVGPTQFVVTINSQFRSYTKSGAADGALDLTPDAFFAPEMTPVGPSGCNFTSDPHIRYDRLSQRWFVVMIDVPGCNADQSNRIMIAVSDNQTLTLGTTWTFFHIDAPALLFADYPTLGIDAHALYIGTNDFATVGGAFARTDGYVVQKSSILGGGPIHSTLFAGLAVGTGAGPYTPQGVDDPYDADPAGYFVGTDNAQFGKLDVVRVADPGGTPTTTTLPVTVPATAFPALVPHLGNTGGNNGRLDGLDDRLFAATMTADGHIWTAHGIGVNATGAASGSPSRDAARWYELHNVATTPSLAQSGTVFDSAASSPAYYWMPTVAVSGQGIMAIGGSQAGASLHADAWYASRLPGDAPGSTSAPTAYTASTFAYNPSGDPGGTSGRRWGDYSLTRVDPNDNQTLWTIQEYTSATDTWGVRIARLRAPGPATPAGTSAPVTAGTAGTHVTLTGTSTGGSGWYDPGAGFPQRLQVSAGCGVTVSSVTFGSPTSLDLVLDATGATPGTCAVTTTNPDGQSSSGAVLQVTPPPFVPFVQPDGLVKLAARPTSLGDNVYNATGSGQAVLAKRRHRRHQVFTVTVQNDGNTADAFRLVGAGRRRGFAVSYLLGTTDVTAAVVGGTFVTPMLAPGSTVQLRLVVRVKRRARIGSVGSWLVTATSAQAADRVDAVKAKVRVIR